MIRALDEIILRAGQHIKLRLGRAETQSSAIGTRMIRALDEILRAGLRLFLASPGQQSGRGLSNKLDAGRRGI